MAFTEMGQFDEKVLMFLKKTIHQFYNISGSRIFEYKHRRLGFLCNVVLEFEKILDEMGGLDLETSYRTWLSSCIIHIRDIHSGYGIRDIAYALLVVWYRRFPDEADIVMRRFVSDAGCWSDIKRFLSLWRELGGSIGEGGVVGRVVSIIINQLWIDYGIWNRVFGEYMEKLSNGFGPFLRPRAYDYISNTAKWVPREKSKYSWLYDYFVIAWATKACWRIGGGHCMDRWRKEFRKLVSCLCRELYQEGRIKNIKEANDYLRMVWEGGDIIDEAEWRIILEQFCLTCCLAIDTIPIVNMRYYEFGTDDFWRAISYAILISQRGNIGRFMLGNTWIVSRREDDISDIVARIRKVVGVNLGCVISGGSQKAIDLLMEASEISGYECKDKLFYIGT